MKKIFMTIFWVSFSIHGIIFLAWIIKSDIAKNKFYYYLHKATEAFDKSEEYRRKNDFEKSKYWNDEAKRFNELARQKLKEQ